MPRYPSLFDGSPDRPRQTARDLVAYLETLGRARELAGPEGEAHARSACNCADDEMALMAFHTAALNASPEKARRSGSTPALPANASLERGQDLYLHNCASCHGAKGDGRGAGVEGLHPPPAALSEHEYSQSRLSFVLENGVAGTSMPAWRDFSLADRAALAQAVRRLHSAQPEPAIPAPTLELGSRVYRANCAQCHGENGAGDGFAVPELRIVPANLRGVRPNLAQSLSVLRNGIDGTQMAPWTGRLSEAELSAVAYYVRTFFQGDAR
jgi:mono/diheme cytochrome c family protein